MTLPTLRAILDAAFTTPANDAFTIAKNDSTDLAHYTRGIYVGGAGDIALITLSGTTVTFVGVLAGSVIPVRAKRVLSTGTTASNMLGLI